MVTTPLAEAEHRLAERAASTNGDLPAGWHPRDESHGPVRHIARAGDQGPDPQRRHLITDSAAFI
jgi:hypothetical protein